MRLEFNLAGKIYGCFDTARECARSFCFAIAGFAILIGSTPFAQGMCPQAPPLDQLEAPAGGATTDSFGKSISGNLNFLAVGVPGLNVTASGGVATAQGGVHIYSNAGDGIFNYQTTLTAENGLANDNCGIAVTSTDDFVVAGAPGRDVFTTSNQLQAGIVWVWNHATSGWNVTPQELFHPAPKAIDLFGAAIAIDEQTVGALTRRTIVVGAPTDDVAPRIDCGSVCVFQWSQDSGGWIRTAFITAPTIAGEDWSLLSYGLFGSSVEINGDFIFVGAKRQTVTAPKQGTTFVFRRNTPSDPAPTVLQTDPSWGEWCLVQTLVSSEPYPDEQFGSSISASVSSVIVGAPGGSTTPGSASIFSRDELTGTYAIEGRLFAPLGHAGDQFGAAVAMKSDVAVVGEPGFDAGSIPIVSNRGIVYLFQQDLTACGIWQQGLLYYPPAQANVAEASFGAALDVFGNIVAIAAPKGPNQQLGQGIVFSYGVNSVSCPYDLTGDGGVDGSDMSVFFSHWNGCGPADQFADYNGDGCVNGGDLPFLFAIWGPCVCGD